jgi:hypothetical protein
MHGSTHPDSNARFLAFVALLEKRTPYQAAMIIAAMKAEGKMQ